MATGHPGSPSQHALNHVAPEIKQGPELAQTQPLAAVDHTVRVLRWIAKSVTPKCVQVRLPVDLNVVCTQL